VGIVVGIDPSLNGTGLARYVDGTLVETAQIRTGRLGHQRLEFIEDRVVQFLFSDGAPDLAVIEGPSYGSKSSSYHQLAGGWWITAHRLWEERIPYGIVPPSKAKKYATGKGNADKLAMFQTATGPLFPHKKVWPKSHDEADAVILAAMGQRWLGHPVDKIPEDRWSEVWDSEWPDRVVFRLRGIEGETWPSTV
jgi:crossover junction endodeoxyribonuclease RuvC